MNRESEEILAIQACPAGWCVVWNDPDPSGAPVIKPIVALALVRYSDPRFECIAPVVAWDDTGFELAMPEDYGAIIGPDGASGALPAARIAGADGGKA